MNFLTMFLIFFLIRNLMSGFTNPKPQESPASIIENYNQSLKNQDTQSVESTGPVSSIFGLMKGMMPIKKGENGATYVSTLKDGDLCVCIFLAFYCSPFMCTFRKQTMTVL